MSGTAVLTALMLAHGTPPQALQVRQSAGITLVGTTFGALLRDDERCGYHWVCEKSVGYSGDERPVWFVSASKTLFAAAYSGVYRSNDRGCSWSKVESIADTGGADIAGDASAMFVVSGRFGANNGVFRSTDDGLSFKRLNTGSSAEYFSAVTVDGPRVLVSSWYFEPQAMALHVSADRGDTFARIELTERLPSGVKGAFTVHAVAGDTLYASVFNESLRPQSSSVVRSDDLGQTWRLLFRAEGRVAQISTAESQAVFVAVGGVVFRGAGGENFAMMSSPTAGACVFTVGTQTLACGDARADGYAVASFGPDGEPIPWLEWSQITGPQLCAVGSPGAALCDAAWPIERIELDLDDVDAGFPSECTRPAGPRTPPCGCSESAGGALCLGLAALALRVRRPPTARKSV